jgi:hypothetical protein
MIRVTLGEKNYKKIIRRKKKHLNYKLIGLTYHTILTLQNRILVSTYEAQTLFG